MSIAFSIIAIVLFSLLANSIFVYAEKSPTPREQLAKGISLENVVCPDSMVVVAKSYSTHGSVVCVKPQTAEKLVKWRYAIGILFSFDTGLQNNTVHHKEWVRVLPQPVDIIGKVDYERYRTGGHIMECEHFTLTVNDTKKNNLGNIKSNIFTLDKKIDVLPNDAINIEYPFNQLTEDIKGKKIHVIGFLFKEYQTSCVKPIWDASGTHIVSFEKDPNPVIVAKSIDVLDNQ